MVDWKKLRLMIRHNLIFFFLNTKFILEEWWIKPFREWLNLESLWNSLIFLDKEHDRLFAVIIRMCSDCEPVIDLGIEEVWGIELVSDQGQ